MWTLIVLNAQTEKISTYIWRNENYDIEWDLDRNIMNHYFNCKLQIYDSYVVLFSLIVLRSPSISLKIDWLYIRHWLYLILLFLAEYLLQRIKPTVL